jgi:cell shape-determining protein MreC
LKNFAKYNLLHFFHTTRRIANEAGEERHLIVIKIGSNSLANEDGTVIDAKLICCLVETIIQLRKLGHSVILVTSGAVSIGCLRLVHTFSLLLFFSERASTLSWFSARQPTLT